MSVQEAAPIEFFEDYGNNRQILHIRDEEEDATSSAQGTDPMDEDDEAEQESSEEPEEGELLEGAIDPKDLRYFPTPVKAEPFASEELRMVLVELCENVVKGFEEVLKGEKVPSRGGGSENWDVYHGTAGVARLFIDIHQRDPNIIISGSKPRELAQKFIEHAVKGCEDYLDGLMKYKTALHNCGYVLSPAGVWATAAVVYQQLEQKELADEFLARMVHMHRPAFSSHASRELFYGRPGYLHSLLYIHSTNAANPKIPPRLISDTFTQIYKDGTEGVKRTFTRPADRSGCGNESFTAPTPLLWSWHVERYTGVAHGVAGVLLAMMDLPGKCVGDVREEMKKAVDYLISLKTWNGNFAVRVDETIGMSPQLYETDELMQICHGAPGITLLLLRAHELFQDPAYLSLAIQISETIWSRGLLKKGVGLCHGLAGNAAVFFHLYRSTSQRSYLQKAHTYLRAAMDWEKTYVPILEEEGRKGKKSVGEEFG
ncbi:Glutathione S-transferase lancl1, partial [Rhizophlyctis rosea]